MNLDITTEQKSLLQMSVKKLVHQYTESVEEEEKPSGNAGDARYWRTQVDAATDLLSKIDGADS